MMSKKKAMLPLVNPIFSTYHSQGNGAATIYANPSIRNWYLNNCTILKCNKKFLSGYSSPDVNIMESTWYDNPYLNKFWLGTEYTKGYINHIIRALIDDGRYICFDGIDDYYIPGKTWYKTRHFGHDGMIYGYDQEKKTYSIQAYDTNWIFKTFEIPQEAFNKGRKAMLKRGKYSYICALKPTLDPVEFEPKIAISKIKEYLDSSFEKYPINGEGDVYGIVVQDYLALYVYKLFEQSIPYEKMDYRVFRLLWEHKKAMYERLVKIEKVLMLDKTTSEEYKSIVSDADDIRLLYASHNLKRRDSVLPVISQKLVALSKKEFTILSEFVKKAGGVLENESLE